VLCGVARTRISAFPGTCARVDGMSMLTRMDRTEVGRGFSAAA
jgi:hypothetical protein